jgi:hypothetical protein
MAILRIVSLGDSVPWGQGLVESEKYDILLKAALSADGTVVQLTRLAHSGAVIASDGNGDGPADGEVPVARPTVIEQCDAFTDSPETVDLVLVNGGINDVGVATILNPFALVPPLAHLVRKACRDSMLALLQRVVAKFAKPSCKILVTGYYTVLSPLSDPLGLGRLLSMHGVATPVFVRDVDLFDPVVARCEEFAVKSADSLKAAVAAIGDTRVGFVPSGFTDANAASVPGTSLLWGLDAELNPEDEVVRPRHAQCDITFGSPLEVLRREQCYRASAGHPNPRGAVQFKRQILSAIRPSASPLTAM